MHKRLTILLSLLLLGTLPAAAKNSYPPTLEGAKVEVYKTTKHAALKMWIYGAIDEAENAENAQQKPAIVFFFGGGWRSGSPEQFHQHCRQLASQGFVAATADYRVSSRHKTVAKTCVEDAKSAVRWLRTNAERLGIDPDRICAAGGSAGGHIAACTGTIKGFDQKQENQKISSVPNAMVLFNPACVLAPIEGKNLLDAKRVGNLKVRLGVEPKALSPYHHISKQTPPTLIFHGKADVTVPYSTAEHFTQAMKKAGNTCRLVGFDDMPHGFFNHGRYENRPYLKTMMVMEAFFVELGWTGNEVVADKEQTTPPKPASADGTKTVPVSSQKPM